MNITPELLNKLTPEAAERFAVLQFLLASTSPDEAKRIVAERAALPTHQLLPDGRAVVMDTTDSVRKGLAKQIRDSLVGMSLRPIDLDYGLDLEAAVKDIKSALEVSEAACHVAGKQWRVPKAGDKVKLIADTPKYGTMFAIGGVYEIDQLATYGIAIASNSTDPDAWKKAQVMGVMLKTDGMVFTFPITDVEAINE